MNVAAWVSLAVGITILLSFTGVCLRWLYVKVLHPMALLAEDWAGEPPRPGVAARPGVMERLAQWEERQTLLAQRVGALEEWRRSVEIAGHAVDPVQALGGTP